MTVIALTEPADANPGASWSARIDHPRVAPHPLGVGDTDDNQRAKGCREPAMGMHPWVWGHSRANVSELIVHHGNPNTATTRQSAATGNCSACNVTTTSTRAIDHTGVSASAAESGQAAATSNPFANLKAMLKRE